MASTSFTFKLQNAFLPAVQDAYFSRWPIPTRLIDEENPELGVEPIYTPKQWFLILDKKQIMKRVKKHKNDLILQARAAAADPEEIFDES